MSDLIILLHGMGQHKLEMHFLGTWLEEQGYATLNIGYPSTRHKIEDLCAKVHTQIGETDLKDYKTVHFVGHSMGGVIAHSLAMSKNRPANFGKVVALGSPFNGVEVADRLGKVEISHSVLGPAFGQMTKEYRTKNPLPEPDYPLGVVTGTNNWMFPLTAWIYQDANDGLVSVEDALLPGLTDHISVAANHNWLMNNEIVRAQIIYFFKNGKFEDLRAAQG